MERAKEAAGRRAAAEVTDGMAVGLGTGSTVHFALTRLAERIRKEGLGIRGVPTSRKTEEEARRLGIPLIGLHEVESLDLAIDGADEVDARFNMIKGGGGALLKEKVVAAASRRRVIVVDRGKLVETLGRHSPLPVEVLPFARTAVHRALVRLGAKPELRKTSGKTPFRTEHGNEIIDCRFSGGIPDSPAMEKRIALIPGVVESGLFIGLAEQVVIGDPEGGVEVREKPDG